MHLIALSLLSLSLCAGVTAQQDAGKPDAGKTVSKVDVALMTTDNYPLDTCLACSKQLTKDPKVVEVDGRALKTCGDACSAKVRDDAKPFLAKLDAAVIAAQDADYPSSEFDRLLTRCAVCRKPFDKDKGPVNAVAGNTLIKVCSDGCAGQVDRVKRRTEVVIRSGVARRTATYAVKTCPVCDRAPSEKPVWVQHGTTLVKLCCEECLAPFKVTPNTFVDKVAAAAMPEGKKPEGEPGKDPGDGKAKGGDEAAKPPVKK